MERMDIDDHGRAFQPDPTYSGDEDSGFGMSVDEIQRRMQGLVGLAIAKRKLLGLPVVRYDEGTGTVSLEVPDGSRTPWH